MRSRNEAAESEGTIARPCVKNEDIQMEIWFYINHQPRPSPRRSVWQLFCLPSLRPFLSRSLPSFSSLREIGAYISLRCLPSPFSFSRFDPRFPARSRSPRALRRSFEARDRRSYRWQRDSFVLSRRFQLIFIVYLPEQRYLEDNGPPRYIRSEPYHANAEVYSLSSPASDRRGSLLSPHPRLICRRRIAWIGIAECAVD